MIKLELSELHVQIIGDALVERPYKIVASVLAEIAKQIDAHNQAQQQTQEPRKESGNGQAIDLPPRE